MWSLDWILFIFVFVANFMDIHKVKVMFPLSIEFIFERGFFDWIIHENKLSKEYASNLHKCVNKIEFFYWYKEP